MACAYDAGDVIYDNSSHDRWKMRQYPLYCDAHASRFVRWFNDCFRLFKEEDFAFEPAISFWQQLKSDTSGASTMEFVYVTYKEDRDVLVDGQPLGSTHKTLMVVRGHHRFTLDGEQNYQPPFIDAVIQNTTSIIPHKIKFD